MAYRYALVTWYSEEDGMYLVRVPELPGCMADGETIEEATQAAQVAIQMWIETARKLGRQVPQPIRYHMAEPYLPEFEQPIPRSEIEGEFEQASETETRYHQVREQSASGGVHRRTSVSSGMGSTAVGSIEQRIKQRRGNAIMAKLETIEGIGGTYAKKLQKAGVATTQALLEQGATPKGRKEIAAKTGIGDTLILKWVNRADLFRIKGIGEEYADLLEAAGVDTVPDLARRKAENLYKKMVEVNEAKQLVRQVPAQSQVGDWIKQAKKLPRVMTY